jgi:peptide/nickel transport system substrate-binding protein
VGRIGCTLFLSSLFRCLQKEQSMAHSMVGQSRRTARPVRVLAAASALAMVAVACGGGGKKSTATGGITTSTTTAESTTSTTAVEGGSTTSSTAAVSSNVTTATTARPTTATTTRRTTATTATKAVTKGPAGNIINVTAPPSTAPNKAAQPGGTITWLTSSEQIGYDPVNVSGAGSADGRAAAMIFDMLVYNDANGVVQPQTAESLTSTDALVWTLKLKPNIKFSDGTPYDAAAVKFNYQRMQDPANRASRAAQVNLISAMDVVDAQTLRLTLKAKNAVFPQALVLIAFIGSPTAIQKQGAADFNNNPVGAGPYTMKSWVRDSQMTMVRNPNYWNAPLPYVDSYILRPIPDETQRVNSYCAGQGNMAFITVLSNADQIRKQNCGTMIPSVLNGGIVLYFNTTKAPMNDARLRKAVAMAIDVNDYSKVVDGGLIPPMKSVFDPSSPFYDQGIQQQPFNPTQAQALFDQVAADNGGNVSIPMSTYALVNYQTTAQYIQAVLQKYNHVKVDLVSEAPPAHVTSCQTRAYAGICVNAGFFTDPEPGWTGTFICASPASPTGYCNPAFDAAVADNQLTLDPAKRIADIKDAQKQLYADVPAYYLEQRMTWTFTAPNIQDFQYVNDGLPLIDRLWIKSH